MKVTNLTVILEFQYPSATKIFVLTIKKKMDLKRNYLKPILNDEVLRELACDKMNIEGSEASGICWDGGRANEVAELLKRLVISARGILLTFLLLPRFLKEGATGGIGFGFGFEFGFLSFAEGGGIFSLLADCWDMEEDGGTPTSIDEMLQQKSCNIRWWMICGINTLLMMEVWV